MKNLLKVFVVIALLLTMNVMFSTQADAAKIMWGKTELKEGQIGKVTILAETDLVKFNNEGKLTKVRTLKKGDEYRVYSYKAGQGGLYGVGGSSYVQKSAKIKYETPSKSKLEQLKIRNTVKDAVQTQATTYNGNYYTATEVTTILNTNFTDSFINQYMTHRMLEEVVDGEKKYHVPGSDDSSLIVSNFSWTDKTQITYFQKPTIEADNKKGAANYVKISEHRPNNDIDEAHIYNVILLKTSDGSYKVSDVIREWF